jgi:hypothetical protein
LSPAWFERPFFTPRRSDEKRELAKNSAHGRFPGILRKSDLAEAIG